ncbi:hypothetical protein ABGB18_28745 [Nonomuraea sp. B12E4]
MALIIAAGPFLLGALRFLVLFLGLRATLGKARQADLPCLYHDFSVAVRGEPGQMGGGSKSQFILARSTKARRASG